MEGVIELDGAAFARRFKALVGTATQKEVAARLGIRQQLVSQYLRGRIPAPEHLVAISKAYNVTIGWLLTGVGPQSLEEAICAMESGRRPTEIRPASSPYIALAAQVGALVTTKQQQYGDSFGAAPQILRLLYPNGIRPDQYQTLLCIVRILDKVKRLATGHPSDTEDPWLDIAGYSLLALHATHASAREDARKTQRRTSMIHPQKRRGVHPRHLVGTARALRKAPGGLVHQGRILPISSRNITHHI